MPDPDTDPESPATPGHMPGPEGWPGGGGERELTEYTEPPGRRDEPGGRERERDNAPDPA